jgi:ring-1,2-phenylacetyl-CoA epoxidase subunit PaaD
VSEGGTHTAIARARAGASAGPSATDLALAARARAVVAAIPDPELPVVTIADLGMLGDVTASGGAVRVGILPTFVGCPALDVLETAIREALRPLAGEVEVAPTYTVPWTSDRITDAGRAALTAAGIAPPAEPEDVRCPFCGAATVVQDSAFGPTQCRSLFYCRGCRQPFEAMKRV